MNAENNAETGAHLNAEMGQPGETTDIETVGPMVVLHNLPSRAGKNVGVLPGGEDFSLVRANFNPSGMPVVDDIKLLAAALISVARHVQKSNPAGGREAAIAITHLQTASMFAVAAATAGK